MASNLYIKSLIWLACAGGVGYGLLRLTAPSEEKLAQIKASGSRPYLTEDERKKQLFMQHMRDAAEGKTPPIYLQKKDK